MILHGIKQHVSEWGEELQFRADIRARRARLLDTDCQYCLSTLAAAWGHPETKGSLPAYTCLLHGSLIPLHTAVFCCQAQLKSSLPVSAPMSWKRPETGQANCGGIQRWPQRQLLFFMHPLRVQRCRVQKTGYLWTRFLRLFYCRGWRTSCLTRWSSVGSHSKWTFALASFKNMLGESHNLDPHLNHTVGSNL